MNPKVKKILIKKKIIIIFTDGDCIKRLKRNLKDPPCKQKNCQMSDLQQYPFKPLTDKRGQRTPFVNLLNCV